jgi:hypothetical protein
MTMLSRTLIISTTLAVLLLGGTPSPAQEVPTRRPPIERLSIGVHASTAALASWIR